jgi:hypothetical protein
VEKGIIGVPMDGLRRGTLGFVLVSVILLSCCLMMVQIVNAFKPEGLLKKKNNNSLALEASGRSFCCVFYGEMVARRS